MRPAAAPIARLRVARPDDLTAVQRFVAGLSVQSRAQRFFTPLLELPRDLARALGQGDPSHHFVLAQRGDELLALGEYATHAQQAVCELAFTVSDAWQGCGLGARLMARLLHDAGAAGLREARLETQRDNLGMKRLAQRAGFVLSTHPDDPGLLLGLRTLSTRDAGLGAAAAAARFASQHILRSRIGAAA